MKPYDGITGNPLIPDDDDHRRDIAKDVLVAIILSGGPSTPVKIEDAIEVSVVTADMFLRRLRMPSHVEATI